MVVVVVVVAAHSRKFCRQQHRRQPAAWRHGHRPEVQPTKLEAAAPLAGRRLLRLALVLVLVLVEVLAVEVPPQSDLLTALLFGVFQGLAVAAAVPPRAPPPRRPLPFAALDWDSKTS